jgi:creatinine amidohydrolase
MTLSGILQEMTIDEVKALKPEVVVLGVGSTEPHGPALVYGTDHWQCDAVCRRATVRANEKGGRVLMYPTLAIGCNVNFKRFPFVCRIGVRTLMHVLLDVIRALEEEGIRKIVLVDGHGGNTDAMRAALREHVDLTPADRRAFVCITRGFPSKEALDAVEHPSIHGGESEVSRQLYVRPELVRTDRLQDQPFGVPMIEALKGEGVYWVRPWHLHVPMAGGGDTRKASAEKGKALIESTAESLADFLVELSKMKWHAKFPYPPDARQDY